MNHSDFSFAKGRNGGVVPSIGAMASVLAVLLAVLVFGCAGATKNISAENPQPPQEVGSEDDRGIEVESVRLTAAGYMVDFRYRVTDPDKAAAVFDRRNTAYLVDQASGIALSVPRTAKVGPLRQTNFQPDPERVYFILFSNSGGLIKPGSLVTLVVGDYRFENIVVQ